MSGNVNDVTLVLVHFSVNPPTENRCSRARAAQAELSKNAWIGDIESPVAEVWGRGGMILLGTHALVFKALAGDRASSEARKTMEESELKESLACCDIHQGTFEQSRMAGSSIDVREG